MLLLNIIFSVLLVLRTHVYCEVNGIQTTLLNGLVDGLNNLPEKAYIYDNGVIVDAQKEGDKLYKIQAKVRATDIANEDSKHMQCSATLQLGDDETVVINNHQCDDLIQGDQVSVTSTTPSHKPLVLDNEVSTDTAVTSGEQFVAVPKHHCIGCSINIVTDAPGVSELAALAVKHIDIHEPGVKHNLNHVLEVQRQVQIVNGVRYILKLSVDYTISSLESDTGLMCNKICTVTILEKPWAKLPDGSKYRAILANNCTAEWLFGDEGEVISVHETNDDNKTNGEINRVHTEELSSVPKAERILTMEELKALQEQIIPHNSVIPAVGEHNRVVSNEIPTPDLDIKNKQEFQSGLYYSTSEINNIKDSSNLSEDKKKSIDEFMNKFEFSEFNPTLVNHRLKRTPEHWVGGVYEKDVNDKKYWLLAEKSLEKYVSISGVRDTYKVSSIEKVTEQVVSGTLTKIIFNVALYGSPVTKCESTIWNQPWLGEPDITVKCNMVTQNRSKTQIAGGEEEKNPKDNKYKLLADESLKKYISSSGNGHGSQVVSVDRVTEQVVAGIVTKINFTADSGLQVVKCHSEVWEQPWLDFKDIKVDCGYGSNVQTRRSNLGGEYSVDPKDPRNILLAEKSMNKFVTASGKNESFHVVGITKAVQQVVNGLLTKLDFKIQPIDNSAVLFCHSEIHEPSSNDKELSIDVGCNPLLGGKVEKDASDPKYLTLAQESLNSYTNDSKLTLQLKLHKVEKVTEQLVNGLITEIDFKISTMDNASIYNCHSNIYTGFIEPITKDIKVECDLSEDKSKLTRSKRQIAGGEEEKNPKDNKYKLLADESLKKYISSSGNGHGSQVVSVDRVTEQVVAGIVTKINFTADSGLQVVKCHSEVWEQSWSNFKDIKVDCGYGSNVRTRRSNLGGEYSVDPKDPRNILLAEKSMNKFVTASGKNESFHVVGITKAVQQVVNGLLTKLDFKIQPIDNSAVLFCHSEIHEPSSNDKELSIDVGCNPLLGGKVEKDASDPKYLTLAQESLNSYTNDSKLTLQLKLHKVEKVTEQLVNGLITEIDFKISTMDNASIYNCHSNIYTGFIEPITKDIKVECHLFEDKSKLTRSKRQTAGGEEEKNPKDNKYKLLADESLKKYISSSGNGHGSQVVSVDRVTEQVVAGILYKINFTADSGLQVVKCHSEVWEQSWSNFKDIKVDCGYGSNVRTRRSNLGGEYSVDPKDPRNILLAEKSMNKFVTASGKNESFHVVGITKAVQQVVNGLLTKLDFKIQPIDNSAVLFCHSEIHEPSSNDKELSIDVGCNPLLGGKVEKDASDPKYLTLAQESLNSYTNDSKLTLQLKLHKVEKVTEQLVNGLITEIDFKISTMDNASIYNCHSNIYTGFIEPITKDIKVECDLAGHKISKRNVHYARNEELSQDGSVDTSQLDSETANVFANEALKHIEAKYPHPRKQAIVKIFSATQAIVAGKHYRLKVEVGLTNCTALSNQQNCQLVTDNESRLNKFCKVNMWAKSNTEHPPSFRVTCDDQSGNSSDVYHHIQAERLFYNFLTTYQPSYLNDHAEMYKRFNVFKDNILKIHELNIYERGTATYAVTKFADLTYEEFSKKYLGLKPSLRNMNYVPMRKATIPDIAIPDHFDWRDKGAVTEVKNQGACGSCWAFSVTGNIEGQWKLKSGKLLSLSEQELVDCDKLDQGCNGGLPDNAYRAIEQLGGLETEVDYPYDGSDDKCSYNRTLSRVTINGAVNISTNEQDIAKWLVSNGPISIGINANAMQFYIGGISHPWKVLCNASNLDHGVLIVGYGAKDYPLFKKHLPYWTIKNSWGPSWGEQGYYRVYRGDGTCGVNKMASSAVIT